MESKYFASMYHIPYDSFDFLESQLEHYGIEKYALSFEAKNSKGEDDPHFHCFYFTYKKNQTNWEKTIVEKFKLRRKGRGGLIKYGTLTKIRDLDKMLSYTLKEEHFRSKGFTDDELKMAIEQSFKKSDTKLINQIILEQLIEKDLKINDLDKLRYLIIQQILQPENRKVPLSKARVDSIAILYVREVGFDNPYHTCVKAPTLFEIMYNRKYDF